VICPTCGHERETFQGEEGTGGFVPPKKEGNVTDEEKAEEFYDELDDLRLQKEDALKIILKALRAERLAVLESSEVKDFIQSFEEMFNHLDLVEEEDKQMWAGSYKAFTELKEKLKGEAGK
jgi:hypothetical protein